MKTTEEKMAVMQAFVDGRAIQMNAGGDEWMGITYPEWDWGGCDYRIKPEPKRMWVNEYKDGLFDICHTAESAARDSADAEAIRTAVEYVEVTDKIRKLLEAEQ